MVKHSILQKSKFYNHKHKYMFLALPFTTKSRKLIKFLKKFFLSFNLLLGRIVNVTGSNGKIGIPCNSAFCMTKYGQEGFTDVLRMEMRKFGIKVITVEPGNFSASTAMLNKSKVCIKS